MVRVAHTDDQLCGVWLGIRRKSVPLWLCGLGIGCEDGWRLFSKCTLGLGVCVWGGGGRNGGLTARNFGFRSADLKAEFANPE